MRTNFKKRKNSIKRNIDIIVKGKLKINIFQPQVSITNPQYLQFLPRCFLTYVSFSLKTKKSFLLVFHVSVLEGVLKMKKVFPDNLHFHPFRLN